LKGFDTPVEAYELVGRPDLAESTRKWREAFEQAVGNYEGGHFEFARMGFNRTLELKPGDGPSQFYLGRLQDIAELPVRDWTGDTQVFEK
jgi:adenylate cyclase